MKFKRTLIAASLMAAGSAAVAAPSNQEIWDMMQKMQQQMTEMQQQNQQLKAENAELKNKVAETEQAVEAVAEASEQSSGPLFSGKNTTIGGYGEVHFNNLDGKNGASDKDEVDVHRFVLYFGHEFTDNLRFFSELELEHALAGEGKDGEVELEQAYIEYDINDHHRVKGGVFLVPVGILNETHEPNTFYGVERNNVEARIIPSTWWEAGIAFSGELSHGFSYDAALHSGLNVNNTFAVRSGRQKVSEAEANDLAYTGRLKWTGMPGVELAATLQYQENIAQGNIANTDDATLFETHAVIERGPFGFRALYAQWDLEGDAPEATGADEQEGWYVEPSYRINDYFGVFARYSEWDNQAGSSSDSEFEQYDIGVNWWPHKNVVIKADYQDQEKESGEELKGFNLGIGYEF